MNSRMIWFVSVVLYLNLQMTKAQSGELRPSDTCSFTEKGEMEFLQFGKCPSICFDCPDGSGCLNIIDHFCDLNNHCEDGGDEMRYNATANNTGIACFSQAEIDDDIQCTLPQKYVCDGLITCLYGEDECNCKDDGHVFECAAPPLDDVNLVPKQCLPRRRFCDNILDCEDKSDEIAFSYGAPGFHCPTTKTGFTFSCMLPFRYVCDGVTDCDDATDECFCDESNQINNKSFWNDRCFRCLDRSLVIPRKQLCDGIFHCLDLSDECLCRNKTGICDQICSADGDCGDCKIGEVTCEEKDGISKCINRTSVCDQNFDCPLGEDERNCNIDYSQVFNCTEGPMYIPSFKRCDNVPNDCPDGSDEENCSQYYKCKEFDEEDFATPRYAEKCDSFATCEDLDDECNSDCENPPQYCNFISSNDPTLGFRCNVTDLAIIGAEICDGFPTCNETFPQSSVDELYCHNRFYCDDRGASGLPIHLPLSFVCDGISDCQDQSDEMNCSDATHFYCGPPRNPFYIRREQVCDNNQDCANGEDECADCSTDPFSSDDFLISSYFLQVWIWIVGLLAIGGNLAVFVHNSWQLYEKRRTLNHVAINHRILVLCVALADLLLGVYLIAIGSVNSQFDGTYCRNDIQWRTSTQCIAIGCIAMISIECSVFLLVSMATFRLLLVTRPHNVRLQSRVVYVAIFFSWVIAFILAFVPLSESQIDYFTTQVWYRNVPFFSLISRSDLEEFSNSFLSLNQSTETSTADLNDGLTWSQMISLVSSLNSSFVPEHYFGYYSAHGVCLPRIFPDPEQDQSWGYSLFLILINFFAFLYMAAVYFVIYRITLSKQRKAGQNEEMTNKLQRKISRIIVTNGCCWIPVCIMAFVSAGGGDLSLEAYAVSAIILLPINSAFNPLLYSDVPELVWEKFFAHTRCGIWTEKRLLHQRSVKRAKSTTSFSNGKYSKSKGFSTKVVSVSSSKMDDTAL